MKIGFQLAKKGLQRGKIRVYDGFDRADNTMSLGKADTGQQSTATTGIFGISGGKAYSVNGTDGDTVIWDFVANNFIISAKCKGVYSGGVRAGLVLRYADSSNWIMCFCQITGELRVLKKISGVVTQVALVASGIDIVTEHKISVIVQNTLLSFYINDVFKVSVNVSELVTNTKHGITQSIVGAGATWDDLRMELI